MTCAICLTKCLDEQHLVLECGHTFHSSCIIQSLRRKTECPVCRDDRHNVAKEEEMEEENMSESEESSDEEPSETYIDEEDLKLLICALPTNLLKITMRKFKIDTKLKNTQTVCTEIQNHDLRTIICKTLLWILVMNKKPAHLNFVR